MQDFFTWYSDFTKKNNKPWLMLGKGPSFDQYNESLSLIFNTVTLNHVVKKIKADVAHIIDIDVVDDCGEALLKNCGMLVMPWHPHCDNKPSKESLDHYTKKSAILNRMNKEGRLLWYDSSTSKVRHGNKPIVKVMWFSADACVNLLATAGARKIRSLGVDGGSVYCNTFQDLSDKTLLSNKRTNFNKQFDAIAKTILLTGVDYASLYEESPIKIFVATTEAQMLPTRLLEYSIKKHTSMTTSVYPLHKSVFEIPMPKDKKNHPRTPFSFQRFLIPQICGYKGKAIYLDSDMQVFSDIKQLWNIPMKNADLLAVGDSAGTGRRPQFSVMLLDCEKLKWDINKIINDLDSGHLTYEDLMYEMKVAENINPDISSEWNSLESYKEGKTSLVHYTDMNTQPWVSTANPLGYLWFRDLFEALDSGFICLNEVQQHIDKGYIRPTVRYQIENQIEDSFLLPKYARRLDANFHAHYLKIHSHSGSTWNSALYSAKAALRYIYQKTPLYRLRRKLVARKD